MLEFKLSPDQGNLANKMQLQFGQVGFTKDCVSPNTKIIEVWDLR